MAVDRIDQAEAAERRKRYYNADSRADISDIETVVSDDGEDVPGNDEGDDDGDGFDFS
jgi:hypothetical protein